MFYENINNVIIFELAKYVIDILFWELGMYKTLDIGRKPVLLTREDEEKRRQQGPAQN